jgi:hypothetical protein
MVTIFCLLAGDPFQNSFPLDIHNDQSIGHLKKMIKEEARPALDNVVASQLAIYSVSIADGDDALLQKVYRELGQEEHSIPELHGRTKISTAFPNPDDESLYVIVKRPSKLPAGA